MRLPNLCYYDLTVTSLSLGEHCALDCTGEAFYTPLIQFNISCSEAATTKDSKKKYTFFNTFTLSLLCVCPWIWGRQNNLMWLVSWCATGPKIATTQRREEKKSPRYFSKATLLIQMLLIVQEAHPPSLQAVTVKNVAINQDPCAKYTEMGVRLVEKPLVLRLVREKVFACEREGSGFSSRLCWRGRGKSLIFCS